MDYCERDGAGIRGPWPWYVLLALGWCAGGLLPWMLVLWGIDRRGGRRTALLGLALNLAAFGVFTWYMIRSASPWWWLTSSVITINLLWSASAWLYQRRTLGAAPRRYLWAERASWISPLLIGLVIGLGLSLLTGIPGALHKRQEMRAAMDLLDRDSVLWILIENAYLGLPFGLLLGLWWAGERRRFSASHVITFLSAYAAARLFTLGVGYLLGFLMLKGTGSAASLARSPEWALIPPWITGWSKWLLQLDQNHLADYLVVPLLFGAVPRIRDYWKRLLWLPALMAISFPFVYVHNDLWKIFQCQIVADMDSPKETVRAAAHARAERLLGRYPDHLQWPAIAESVARYRYQHQQVDTSRNFYQAVVQRYQGNLEWHWEVKRAEAALGSPEFGKPGGVSRLDIPMVDYESYLTHNWMALLSIIRYWEGTATTDSNVKIRLKALSKSDDKIQLNPLGTVADLHDAVRSLDYEMVILSTSLKDLRTLLSAGIPVILVDRSRFRVVYGFDDSRSTVLAYGFDELSDRTRQEARQEATEILALQAEGQGESRKRLDRIRHEVETEYSMDFWEEPNLNYRAPLMVAVIPSAKLEELAGTLGRPIETITTESRGYLAAFLGLAFLQHADPVQALEWAQVSHRLSPSAYSLYVGELSRLCWQSRAKQVKLRLPFEDQFPELNRPEQAFTSPENNAFLADARRQFEADLAQGTVPHVFLDAFERTLVATDPDDQAVLMRTGQLRVRLDPSDIDGWRSVAEVSEQLADLPGRIATLEGLSAADPLNFKAKLDLAMAQVLDGNPARAEQVLATIERKALRFDGDYPFCLGAIAEWQGNRKKALACYQQAIEMRRYKPVYHLYYGRLLLAEGRREEAEKALRWAARIDPVGPIKSAAEQLLAGSTS